MSIVIINMDRNILAKFEQASFNTLCCNVTDINTRILMNLNPLVKDTPIYYVSPANSLLFMNGGIDEAYMRMFKNIEPTVKRNLATNNPDSLTKLGRHYLPIGSSMITKVSNIEYLISTATMLMPQPVPETQNAYYAMKAILKLWPRKGTLVLPPLGCGYGFITIENCIEQIKRALSEDIRPILYDEPVLYESVFYILDNDSTKKIIDEQPNYYENTEFKDIRVEDIVRV